MYPDFSTILPYHELTRDQRKSLHRRTLGFIFRLQNYKQYTDHIKALSPATATEVRQWVKQGVLHNGYMMHNVKHWTYAHVCDEVCDTVRDEDYRLLHILDGPLHAGLCAYADRYSWLHPDQTQELISRVWNRNKDFVMRFCWVKLRFVCQQQGYDIEDVANELMVDGLRALRLAWPCYPSELYCDNLFKRTVHNSGINLIEKMTTAKHARLVASGQGFQSLNLQLDAALMCGETAGDQNLVVGITGCQKPELLDLRISINQIEQQLSERKRKLVRSLAYYDPEFSRWLAEHNHVGADEDNEILRDRTSLDRYLRLAADWLKVEYDRVHQFVASLREILLPYQNAY